MTVDTVIDIKPRRLLEQPRGVENTWCEGVLVEERICSVDGCENPRPYKLYCGPHYRRWKRNGDPGVAETKVFYPEDAVCSFGGCGRKVRSSGLCASHYVQKWSGQELKPLRIQPDTTTIYDDGTKLCSRCDARLPVEMFYKNGKIKNGLSPHCKTCHRDDVLLRNYGITTAQYDAMLLSQDGACAICGGVDRDGRNLHVDHDHGCCPGQRSCGECVRALLCSACNTSLGLLGDDPARLRRAAEYLEAHRGG